MHFFIGLMPHEVNQVMNKKNFKINSQSIFFQRI